MNAVVASKTRRNTSTFNPSHQPLFTMTTRAIWHSQFVVNRRAAPQLTGMHTEFFGGTVLDVDPGVRAVNIPRPLRLAKNIYRMPSIWQVRGSLVVSEALRMRLQPLCGCSFVPVTIAKPYLYPYSPGDMTYTTDDAYLPKAAWFELKALSFANKYFAEYSGEPYFEVVAPARPTTDRGDRTPLHFESSVDTGRSEVDAMYSPSELESAGLIRCFGYLFAPRVWEVVQDHLAEHFVVSLPVRH